MKKFEYKIWSEGLPFPEAEKYLNEMGAIGWEVVYAGDGIVVFKREY